MTEEKQWVECPVCGKGWNRLMSNGKCYDCNSPPKKVKLPPTIRQETDAIEPEEEWYQK